jgi:hypothetical protein
MGAAGKNLGLAAMPLEQRAGFGHGGRFEIIEVLQLASLAFKVRASRILSFEGSDDDG